MKLEFGVSENVATLCCLKWRFCGNSKPLKPRQVMHHFKDIIKTVGAVRGLLVNATHNGTLSTFYQLPFKRSLPFLTGVYKAT